MISLHEVILVIITLLLVVGVPFYQRYRSKMISMQRRETGNHSAKRVLKLLFVNLAIAISVFSLFLLAFYSIISLETLNFHTALLAYFFFITLALAFLGDGIYLTSIVLENYTVPSLRKHKAFKTQFLATHLFHGPISHVMIYSNFIIALLILAILDIASYSYFNQRAPWMILSGGIGGAFFAYAQIFNKTYPYQFFTSIGALIVYAIVIIATQASVLTAPAATYFIGFEATFLFTNTMYFVLKMVNQEKINFREAGEEEITQMLPSKGNKHQKT